MTATGDDEKQAIHRQRLERGREQVVRVRSGLERLFAMLSAFTREQARRNDSGPVTVRVTSGVRAQPLWSDVDVLWGEVGRDLLDLQRTIAELNAGLDGLPNRNDVQDAILGELTAQGTAWEEMRRHFSRIIAEADPEPSPG